MQVHLYQTIKQRLLLLILGSVLGATVAEGQSDFVTAGVLFQDATVSVTLEYKIISCATSNTKLCRYRYVILGPARNNDFYVNWKMDFYTCDNRIVTQTNSLLLERSMQYDPAFYKDDMDYSFSALKIYRSFYDVKGSNYKDNSPSVSRPVPISSKPTGISGNRMVDYGDKLTLKQEGGSLGENAQWHWYTSSCGGNPVGEGESITVAPLQNTQYFLRAEGTKGITDCVLANVLVNTKSRPASSIDGRSFFCKGNGNTSMSVNGGKLGKDAHWVWYIDSSGGRPVGTGSELQVSPQKTTRYLVRAEGPDNITESRSFTIEVVDERSIDPISISGLQNICEGNPLELRVVGGKLSADAQWYWYRDNINAANFVANGTQLLAKPANTTTYYVRAEGVCNTTTAKALMVTVIQGSRAPNGISGTGTSVYQGTKVRLSVLGGTLGKNSEWKWYKKSCAIGNSIGTGQNITVRPRRQTDYYVRAESECSKTSCVSRRIDVSRRFVFINIGLVASFRTPVPSSTTSGRKSELTKVVDQKTIGFTIGKVTQSGWYLRGKYTINTKKPTYKTDDHAILDYVSSSGYYKYNGEIQQNRLSVTGGLIYSLSKNTFLLSIGGGYGERNLLWGITEYSYQTGAPVQKAWAKNITYSYKGFEAELGLLVKLPVFNIMFGGNYIFASGTSELQPKSAKRYIDAYAGLGINF